MITPSLSRVLSLSVGGAPRVNEDALFGSLQRIEKETGRLDAASIRQFAARLDAKELEDYSRVNGRLPRPLIERWDSFRADHADALGSGVSAFPRELEFIRAQELEQARKPLNSMRIFPADRSVPLGAREHTWRRRVGRGEAVVTRGDTENYGSASVGRLEQKFPIIYVVCSVRQTYFDMLSNDYAGLDQYGADLREARQIVDERVNAINWNGHAETGVFGALYHPSLAKKVLDVTFGGASPSSADAIVTAVNSLIDFPANYSGEAMQPTVLAVSPKIYRYMAQTRHATGTDTTILQFLLQGQDATNGIKQIVKCQELAGIGPSGEDGLLAFRDEVESCGRVSVAETTSLPVYQSGAMSWITVVFAAIGGVVMPNVGHNVLGYAPAS